jgi:protein gp37
MGKNSAIEWTDNTWNPWYGCHKVSAGCKNCYMYRSLPGFGKQPYIVQRSKTTFRDPLLWQKTAHKRGELTKIFVCSWSDFFIEEADAWRAEAWEIMRQCPDLVFLILTKRIERAEACLPEDWGEGWENVWLGVSVEDQTAAKLRVRQLMKIPAVGHFISAEPLLGLVDLVRYFEPDDDDWDQVNAIQDETGDGEPEEFIEECEEECDWINYGHDLVHSSEHREWLRWRQWRARAFAMGKQLDWVIVGGESGLQARPCHPNWVRSLRGDCQVAKVPFFFKQWGQWLPAEAAPEQRGQIEVEYLKVGRRQAGHVLDGVEWRQFPEFKR